MEWFHVWNSRPGKKVSELWTEDTRLPYDVPQLCEEEISGVCAYHRKIVKNMEILKKKITMITCVARVCEDINSGILKWTWNLHLTDFKKKTEFEPQIYVCWKQSNIANAVT